MPRGNGTRDVCKLTMKDGGWEQMLGDRCFFVLRNNGVILGLARIHVDDHLIVGKVDNPVFQQAVASALGQVGRENLRWMHHPAIR